MEPLSYRTLGAEASLSRRMPERVLQFGDGNFLRGFVDDFIDQMNEKANFDSSVVIVPPASTGKTGRINRFCMRRRAAVCDLQHHGGRHRL